MRLTRRAFRRLVQQALDELPPEVGNALHNAAITVQDWPTRKQLAVAGLSELYELFGLYEGVPLVDRDHYAMALPDKITLFQRPLEGACQSSEELLKEIKVTLVHEIAHHLGWSDAALERLGYG